MSTSSMLPLELLEIIFKFAAYDPKIAHTLAYVSRWACKLTARERWRVICLKSMDQFLCLWRTLVRARGDRQLTAHANRVVKTARCALQHPQRYEVLVDPKGDCPESETFEFSARLFQDNTEVHMSVDWTGVDDEGDFDPHTVSLPSSTPTEFAQHVFFDIGLDGENGRLGSGWTPQYVLAYLGAGPLSMLSELVGDAMHKSEPTKYADLAKTKESKFWHEHVCIWDGFSTVQHFSMNAQWEDKNFVGSIGPSSYKQRMRARELTVTVDGRMRHWSDAVRANADHLQRLHVVVPHRSLQDGYNPNLHIADWELILPGYRAGSVERYFSLPPLWDLDAHSPKGCGRCRYGAESLSMGLTHLRIDIPQDKLPDTTDLIPISMRFLPEVCVVGGEQLGAGATCDRSLPAKTEAGEFCPMRSLDVRPESLRPIWSDTSREAAVLRAHGVGSFARLHLVWDCPWSPGSSSSEESFEVSLRRLIWRRLGWHGVRGDYDVDGHFDLLPPWAPGERRKTHVNRVCRGHNKAQRDNLVYLESLLPQHVPGSKARLQFACRAPSSVLKLGGKVMASTKEQRLKLFWDRAMGGPGSW